MNPSLRAKHFEVRLMNVAIPIEENFNHLIAMTQEESSRLADLREPAIATQKRALKLITECYKALDVGRKKRKRGGR